MVYIMVLGYLDLSGIGWRLGDLYHLPRDREKVVLYSYWEENVLKNPSSQGC
jgi:hypothetical protein